MTLKVIGSTTVILLLIYRPPKLSITDFLSEFSELLTIASSMSPSVVVLGDFNIHLDAVSSVSADFLSLLNCFSLYQHVDFPTHKRGHILDLICSTGCTLNGVSGVYVGVSDHMFITADLCIPNSKSHSSTLVSFRNFTAVDPVSFSTLLKSSSLSLICECSSTDEAVSLYNESISAVLDTLAPLKTRTVPSTHSSPWFTSELRTLKTNGRRLERLYKKTGLQVHSQAY